MNFAMACLYSLLGIMVVFFALILLMLMIKLSTALCDRAERRNSPAVPGAPAGKSAPPGEDEPLVAALLMAVVAEELGAPLEELRFISIREVKE